MATVKSQAQYESEQAALRNIKDSFIKFGDTPSEAYQALRIHLNYGATMAHRLVMGWIQTSNSFYKTAWRTDLTITDLERD
jgi:hypothetical protein